MPAAPAPDPPSPPRPGTPVVACLVVLVALIAGALLLGGRDDADGGAGARAEAQTTSRAHVALVSRRVERIRGLRFRRPVRVEVMAPGEVEAFARERMRAEASRQETAAFEEVGKLLGWLGPDDDLDRVADALYGEQVAGFYDPREERLVLVRGAGVDDLTLAHELAHALEDQHYDLDALSRRAEEDDDASAAVTALTEGTATRVTSRYLDRHPDALSLGDALRSLMGSLGATPLPPAVMRSLVFSYAEGERFVDALADLTGDWRLVDHALRHRPPVSTAEIVDVRRWLRVVRPRPVALAPGRLLADDRRGPWRRVAGSTLGALDLTELLRPTAGAGGARRLAAAWAGGRYELWRRGPLPDPSCAAPCRARDAFVAAVRLEDPAAARAVAGALAAWVVEELDGRRCRDGIWALPDGAGAAVAVRADAAVLALAPDPALAARLARRAERPAGPPAGRARRAAAGRAALPAAAGRVADRRWPRRRSTRRPRSASRS